MTKDNQQVQCFCLSPRRTFIMGCRRFWCSEHDQFHIEFTQHRGHMIEDFSFDIIYDYPIN